MSSQSNPYSLIRSFNLLRHLFLVLGFYPFYSNSSKNRLQRNLLLIYCSIVTFIDISTSILSIVFNLVPWLYKASVLRNVDFIAMAFGELLIFTAALIQKVLYYRKTHKFVDFFKKWESFETEYETLTGKQLKTLDYKKVLLVALITSVVIILVIATYPLDVDYDQTVLEIVEMNLNMLLYIIHYLTSVYTEIIWNMMTIALKNTTRQLMNDYASEECANSETSDFTRDGCDHSNCKTSEESSDSVSRKQHYRYLWLKLSTLQYRFSSVFSSIYGYQMAFNFLLFLFLGFGWTGAIYRYVALKNLDTGEVLQLLGLCVEIGQCFVWIFVGSTTADTAQRAMDIEMKKKLLEIIRRNKQENLPHEEEKIFLKSVSRTKTEMKLGGYGRIDRNFFCKVLLAWANYTLILLQFRNLILDTSKDDPEKKAGLILEWSADT